MSVVSRLLNHFTVSGGDSGELIGFGIHVVLCAAVIEVNTKGDFFAIKKL